MTSVAWLTALTDNEGDVLMDVVGFRNAFKFPKDELGMHMAVVLHRAIDKSNKGYINLESIRDFIELRLLDSRGTHLYLIQNINANKLYLLCVPRFIIACKYYMWPHMASV